MRLLFFTDTHIRSTTPRCRLDNFNQTLKNKFEEIVLIAEREKVDYVLHGGDVFDRPNLPPYIVREHVEIFRKFKVPIYTVAGNHDIYGHNPDTLDRTMLGLLGSLGIFNILNSEDKVVLEKNNITIQLSAQPFHHELDKRDRRLDYCVDKPDNIDFTVHMVHGMLVDKPLPKEVAHTLVNEVWYESVDVLLTGHNHTGFPIQEISGRLIINPGALSRINNQMSEIKRHPKVILLDFSDRVEVTEIKLKSAPKSKDVLDRSYIEKANYREEKLASYVQQIKNSSNFLSIDIFKIIEEISSVQNIEQDIVKEAIKRLSQIQENEEAVSC